MEDEDLEVFFSHVNWVEDKLDEIKDIDLYEYVVSCITNNEYCDIDSFKEFEGDK